MSELEITREDHPTRGRYVATIDGIEAEVPNVTQEQFGQIAEEAKAGCPVSKLFKAEITLAWRLA